jgi:hypothetical protein
MASLNDEQIATFFSVHPSLPPGTSNPVGLPSARQSNISCQFASATVMP